MTAPKIDLSRPVRCRNGAEAGCTLAPDGRLYGWHKYSGFICQAWWHENGTFGANSKEHPYDLIQEPVVVETLWQNIYEGYIVGSVYSFRASADEGVMRFANAPKRIAVLRKEALSDGTHRVEVEKP